MPLLYLYISPWILSCSRSLKKFVTSNFLQFLYSTFCVEFVQNAIKKKQVINLWLSLIPVSVKTSCPISKQHFYGSPRHVLLLLKLAKEKVSHRSDRYWLVSVPFFWVSIFRSPITMMLSYLSVAWFNEAVNSEKKAFLLFECGGLYTKIIHHFFLQIVTSTQIVSEVFPSKLARLFAMNPSLT